MTVRPNDGGYAFPQYTGGGMSLRDYFAAQAVAGMLAGEPGPHLAAPRIGIAAYAVADAMLEARK